MESNYNNKDFEQFLKQNADQYRMFPSEKVWTSIETVLHNRHKWYGISLALLLLLTGAGVTWVMITTPVNKDLKTVAPVTGKEKTLAQLENKNTQQPVSSIPYHAPFLLDNAASTVGKSSFPFQSFSGNVNSANQSDDADLIEIITTSSAIANQPNQQAQTFQSTPPPVISLFQQDLTIPITSSVDKIRIAEEINNDAVITQQDTKSELTNIDIIYPWTIESVVNSFKRNELNKKLSLQLYFTPTVSYRKLSENKAFLRAAANAGSISNYAYFMDLKNVVTHKPDIGLELGLSTKYPLTRTLNLKAGLQFNVTRYDIRAFSSPSEIATIALDAAPGSNSISRETTYRTRSGSNANWLQNLYYSASTPIGLEFRMSQNKKTSFSIASTIQPTYVISDNAYLISTDYKNYIEVPKRLLRRWNFNTGFEALIGYSTKNYQWQIGPQVRYQIRSSFQDLYSVKENLFDFGLKVGVMLNK